MGEWRADPRATWPTALVTGAGGHVGRELVRLLAGAGFAVVGIDRPGVARVTHAIGWVELDLADPHAGSAVQAALDGSLPSLRGRLDLLVHAAGVTALGDVPSLDDQVAATVMAINHHAVVQVTGVLVPALAAARGHVVVVSSLAGLVPAAGRPAYVASKQALTGAFRAEAQDLEARGVGVSVVHPPFLATPVTGAGPAGQRTTAGRALRAEDVARAVVRAVARRDRRGRGDDRIVVGWNARLIDALHRVAPRATVRAGARRLRR